MPATKQSLTNKVNKLAVPIDDDPEAITVWYTNGKLTTKRQRQIQKLMEDGADDNAVVIEQFLTFVQKWDFKNDEGDKEPIPLTVAELEDVQIEVLGAVLECIIEAQGPKAPTAGSSNTP